MGRHGTITTRNTPNTMARDFATDNATEHDRMTTVVEIARACPGGPEARLIIVPRDNAGPMPPVSLFPLSPSVFRSLIRRRITKKL